MESTGPVGGLRGGADFILNKRPSSSGAELARGAAASRAVGSLERGGTRCLEGSAQTLSPLSPPPGFSDLIPLSLGPDLIHHFSPWHITRWARYRQNLEVSTT